MPDMAQTLAAVAVFADGADPGHAASASSAGHETDRIAAVVARAAARRASTPTRTPTASSCTRAPPGPARIETYDDHRMAMSFALLGLRAPGIEIADPGCVAKTFPGFWDARRAPRLGPADGRV